MRKMKICNSITNYFFVNCFPFFKLIHFLNTFLKPRQSNFKLVFSFGFLVIIRRISLPFFLNLEFKMWENISTSWRWRVNDLEVYPFCFLKNGNSDVKRVNYFHWNSLFKFFWPFLIFGLNYCTIKTLIFILLDLCVLELLQIDK